MRVLLLAILLVLLPLRSWVGNAMAVTMAAPGPVQTIAITVATKAVLDCHGLDEAEAHDLPGVASNATEAHGAEHGQAHGNMGHGDGASCSTCAFCQMCHTVALAAPVPMVLAEQATGASPLASLPADLSATPLPGFKPPIA